jgi:hypothetical protein
LISAIPSHYPTNAFLLLEAELGKRGDHVKRKARFNSEPGFHGILEKYPASYYDLRAVDVGYFTVRPCNAQTGSIDSCRFFPSFIESPEYPIIRS